MKPQFFRKSRYSLLARLSLIGALVLLGCYQKGPQTSTTVIASVSEEALPATIDFTFDVKPILSDRCFKCHGPDQNAIEAGLSLHTAEGAYKALGEQADHFAVVPFEPNQSSMVERIYSEDPAIQMPPPESNLSLDSREKEILKRWIEQGAIYQEHWAFEPPKPQEIPEGIKDWGSNAIDAFVGQKLIEKGMLPSPKADKATLIRRVTLDLTGLPPTPEEIGAFVEDDSPEAYQQVVSRLLNSTDHAEHMAAEWMSISRYADTHGYQDDFERIMWPWRDWVIHAFNENMPYDEFVINQLAGDLLPNATKEQILATGFNRNHKITYEGGVIPEEYRVEYVEDRTNTFGTAFLGLTMECARCHDHKYDPISQEEHFELFSFFNNLKEKGLVSDKNEIPEPYLSISPEDVNSVLAFVNAPKESFERESKTIDVMVMKESPNIRETFVLNRGMYDQPTEKVQAGTPDRVLPFPQELPKNRLGLAQWLFHENNPLTARVAVNRLWQRFFGTGIVATSDDFGNQGSLPTHPELLDHLAVTFKTNAWDTREMIRLIVSSETYQQSSQITPDHLERDPENKWLARAPRLRLSAEVIRDQALAVSGLLVKEVGGPSVKPYQPEGIWKETTGGGGGSTARYVLGSGDDLYRKSLYTFWKRTVPPPSMLSFDASNRDLCTVKTQQTNTPLQALVLLNDPQMIEAARGLAERVASKNLSLEEQLSYLYTATTGALAETEELTQLQQIYADMQAQVKKDAIEVEDYLSIGASKVKSTADRGAFAALALTAHTLLNLDQTITRS
ncbi:MAG: DUF1553 domain-containing protein [Flavobacteriaceae bacterium]